MRENKKAIIWTSCITIATFVICIIRNSKHDLIYDLSLACFGSALLGIVIASAAYMAERRDAMEQFEEEARKALVVVRKIPVIEIPELVYNALKDENSWVIDNSEDIDKLKNYIEARLPIDEKTEQYQIDEWIDDRYKSMLEEAKNQLRRAAEAYIEVGDLDLSGLHTAYGRLDFLIGNEMIRGTAYRDIYDKIRTFKLSCSAQCIKFKSYLAGRGNEMACLKGAYLLQDQVFETKDGIYYAKLRDELFHSLETFRSQIYNTEPEYEEPYPVNYSIDFNDPKSVERYERFVEKTEQEGKDMAARNLSILHITD